MAAYKYGEMFAMCMYTLGKTIGTRFIYAFIYMMLNPVKYLVFTVYLSQQYIKYACSVLISQIRYVG